MSELVLASAFARGLGPLNARFDPGLHLVLARAPDDRAALSELCAGVLPARRGAVTLDGDPIGNTPARRREIAALLADEELLAERDVRTSLSAACSLRGLSASPDALLARAGQLALAARDPRTLLAREKRRIACALSLAQTGCKVLVLCEPLTLAPELDELLVIEAARELSHSAIVIVLTATLGDALKFGGRVWWLERGRLEPPATHERPVWPQNALVIRTAAAEQLASTLRSDAAVVEALFEPDRTPFELVLRGHDIEALSLAVTRAARAAGITIDGLYPELPSLDSTLLARAGWVHPSYHAPLGGRP